jgi:hypothetical protein
MAKSIFWITTNSNTTEVAMSTSTSGWMKKTQ